MTGQVNLAQSTRARDAYRHYQSLLGWCRPEQLTSARPEWPCARPEMVWVVRSVSLPAIPVDSR
jgi:hypothetical protein